MKVVCMTVYEYDRTVEKFQGWNVRACTGGDRLRTPYQFGRALVIYVKRQVSDFRYVPLWLKWQSFATSHDTERKNTFIRKRWFSVSDYFLNMPCQGKI